MSFVDVFEVKGRVFRLSMDVADKMMSVDIMEQEECWEDWLRVKKFLPVQNATITNGKTSKQPKRMLDWAEKAQIALGVPGIYSRINNWIQIARR